MPGAITNERVFSGEKVLPLRERGRDNGFFRRSIEVGLD